MIEIPEIVYKAAHVPTEARPPKLSRPTLSLVLAVTLAGAFILFLLGEELNPLAIAASSDPSSQAELGAGARSPELFAQNRIRLHAPASVKEAVAPLAISRERSAVQLDPADRARLGRVPLQPSVNGRPFLPSLPKLGEPVRGKYAGLGRNNEVILYSIDPHLQQFTEEIVRKAAAPHVAVVAMEPSTGRVLAIAGKSVSIPQLAVHAGFPAASIFKIVTAAAAVEHAKIDPYEPIRFRGGTYTLDRWNYLPSRNDRRKMSLAEALGRSCNPVFGRVALSHLTPSVLRRYAEAFGFNRDLGFDSPLLKSTAVIPDGDSYELSRTAAGFGEVTLSPVHAAALVSGIANGGTLVRPRVIDQVADDKGALIFKAASEPQRRIIQPATARRVLEMMEYTVTVGTSKKEFARRKGSILSGMEVAAKTGTLRGIEPEGINHWFVAAAPIDHPKIAVSVITLDPTKGNGKASYLGRLIMEKFFAR